MPQTAGSRIRAGRGAEGFAAGTGTGLVGVGVLCLIVGIVGAARGNDVVDVVTGVGVALVGAVVLAIGVPVTISGRATQKRTAWIQANGIARTARVLDAERTGMEEGDEPIYELRLELDGPGGTYTTTTRRIIPEHQLALLINKEVRVRVHPENRSEVVIED
jgi:hypothetical protein